jgi:hypothetical protein
VRHPGHLRSVAADAAAAAAAAAGVSSPGSTTEAKHDPFSILTQTLPPALTAAEAALWDGGKSKAAQLAELKERPLTASTGGFSTVFDPVVAFNFGLQRLGELEGGKAVRALLRALQVKAQQA